MGHRPYREGKGGAQSSLIAANSLWATALVEKGMGGTQSSLIAANSWWATALIEKGRVAHNLVLLKQTAGEPPPL